jgi:hypothetical protein
MLNGEVIRSTVPCGCLRADLPTAGERAERERMREPCGPWKA